jgi:uncharacterized membrane protein
MVYMRLLIQLRERSIITIRSKNFNEYIPLSILFLMILVYSFVLGNMALIKHNSFGTSGFDIGIIDQGTWLLSQGKVAYVTVAGLHLFGTHVRIIQLFVAPLYWIWDDIRLLLILQTIVISLGALPIYLLAKDKIRNRWITLVFPFSYLLFPSLEYMNLWQYHQESLATTFILFAFYFVTRKKYAIFYLFSLLALICKEDVSLVILFLGMYIYIMHDRKVGIITSLGALLWLFIALKMILPYYGVGSLHLGRFTHLGSGPIGIIKRSIFNQNNIISYVWTPEKREYIFHLLAPVGFLPLLNPLTLFIPVPQLTSNLLSSHSYQHFIRYGNYTATIIPFIFISTIYGSAKLMKNRRSKILIAALLVSTSILSNYYFMNPSPFSKHSLKKYIGYNYHERVSLTNEALSLIPSGASVSATPFFVPHLTHREKIYEFPNPFEQSYWFDENLPSKDIDYVLVSGYGNPKYKHDFRNTLIDSLIEENLYGILYKNDNIGIVLINKIHQGSIDDKYDLVKARMDPLTKELALKERRYSICGKIETTRIREECYNEVGILTNDYNLCAVKIKSQDLRDQCFKEVGIARRDYNLCKVRIIDQNLKDECFKEIGIATKDSNLCDVRIQNQTLKEECFVEIAIAMNDYRLCDEVIDLHEKGKCFKVIAYETGNYVLCSGMNITELKENCFIGIAIRLRDPDICTFKMESPEKRGECFREIAIDALDSSFCEYITESKPLKDECYLDVGKYIESE